MVSDDDYEKIENAILAGEEPVIPTHRQITKPPAGFNEYIRENRKGIEGWKNIPYWVKNNQKFINKNHF